VRGDGGGLSGYRLGLAVRAAVFLVAMLLLVPYVIVVVTSFDASPAAVFPPSDLSLRWYRLAFERPAFREGFVLSFGIALCTAIVSVAVGTAASFVLVRERFPGRALVQALIAAPLMLPQIIIGLGFLVLFTRWRTASSAVSLVTAHVVLTVPFVVRVVSARLHSVSPSMEEAAIMLGANRWQALWRVTLPLIAEATFAAGVFAFAVSFDNFNVSAFLARGRGTLPVEIYSYARTENDPTIAAISTMLMLLSAVGLAGAMRLTDLEALARAGR
jgi:ABC-type spermidine/putrescine transport system permease subunit II